MKRRFVIGGIAASAAALVADSVVSKDNSQPIASSSIPDSVPFRGVNQAGITTSAQDRLTIASFDILTHDKTQLTTMLDNWTAASEEMTQNRQIDIHSPGSDSDSPDDTGETLGDSAGRLTITLGFGKSIYERLGLSLPDGLKISMPTFSTDNIDPLISNGDIIVQACADDPEITFHAIRNLARLGNGIVEIRWMESGFGRTSSTSAEQNTPRNLMGFKDGTRNIKSDETKTLDSYVWTDTSATYMVIRKIEMNIKKWDHDGLDDQEDTFGRHKVSGAPFGQTKEFDSPIFSKMPATAHVRLAAPEQNNDIHILRRGYSFEDGLNSDGTFSGGLFFIAFMKSPQQFIDIQTQLSKHDDLNNYIAHLSTGIFYVPPGLSNNQSWSSQLFT